MAVDFSFLREVEGFETQGYVPQDDQGVIENSGVTVGSGIDLGQWTRKGLEDMGVSKEILDKLEPYLGKKKQAALDTLNQNPLQLSDDEAEELTTTVKKGYTNKVKRWYNRNNKADNDWSDLTDRQQTAITSVAFQYGVGSKNTPSFNKQVLENDWKGLVEELRNFGDRYDTRRHKELQYLVGADVDGVIGPNTEAAIDRFVTTQDVMTPPQPQQTYPQIDPMGFLDNLTAIMQERLQGQQRPSEGVLRSDAEAPTEAAAPELSAKDKMVRALAEAMQSRKQGNEAKLQRTANEAKLEAEAREAGYEPTLSAKDKMVRALANTEVVKSRVYDRSNLNKDVPVEETREVKDDSKDPIFGLF